MVGTSQVDYEHLLNSLEKEKNQYEKLTRKVAKEEKEIADIRSDYESLKKMLEVDQKRIIREARQQAKQIVESANQKIEQTIRGIQESKADKAKTKKLREKLDHFKSGQEKSLKRESEKKKTADFKVGDHVTIEGQDTHGEVMSIKGKQAQVRFGNLISFIDLKKLRKQKGALPKESKAPSKRIGGIDMTDKISRFNGEVDVRGMRAEEAMSQVDAYIDEALLLGTDQIRILHGKGHGILREVLRNHLKGHSSVADVRDEHVEFGGSGISIVTFR